jgi:tRNA(Ile)-lysidine synthase
MESLTHNFLNPTLLLEKLTSLSPVRNYLVAFSGGMDSHVLLHLLSSLKQENPELSVRAVHIHHGLQQAADSWPKHCQGVCDDLGILLETLYLDLKIKPSESLEAVARQGRYQALQGALQKDEVLLTAHHQRDQAETLLLQLFRGAGVQGLAAMPVFTNTEKVLHIRPLLDESYQSLQGYAEEKKLNFIQDPSNKDDRFERNFLRNQILPKLREHWQGLDKTLSRSAKIQSETKALLDQMAEELRVDCAKSTDSFKASSTLSIQCLLGLPREKQKLLIRYWITKKGFLAPSQKKLRNILNEVLLAKEGAQPLVTWQGVEVRRFNHQLYCDSPLTAHDNTQYLHWDGLAPLTIDSLGVTIQPVVLGNSQVQDEPLSVRFRQGGEMLRLSKNNKSQSLKKYLNEAGIPPWLRDRLPLIYSGDRLVKVIILEA